jgi:hypothetical protein
MPDRQPDVTALLVALNAGEEGQARWQNGTRWFAITERQAV